MKLECLNCQKSDVRTNSTCCSVLLCTSFCFLQVNQQKHVGMLSTNNIMYSEQISKYFWQKPFHIVFLIKKRRLADAQMLNSYFIKLKKKEPLEIFHKNTVLKDFTIFTGKHPYQIFKNNYFEEHLHTATSETDFMK